MPVTEEFVRENSELLKFHACQLELGEMLGRGCWGTVFASSDPRWVVKVTKDIEEVSACLRVTELRGMGHSAELLPGLADIFWVSRKLDIEDDGEDLYVIVRENVVPVKDADDAMMKALDEALYVIEEKQAHSAGEVVRACAILRQYAPNLERSMAVLACHGHSLIDLEIGNLGMTSRPRLGVPAGTIVMFDISFGENLL